MLPSQWFLNKSIGENASLEKDRTAVIASIKYPFHIKDMHLNDTEI
jgi:hypothetical protein